MKNPKYRLSSFLSIEFLTAVVVKGQSSQLYLPLESRRNFAAKTQPTNN
jgi:hypothetical protein